MCQKETFPYSLRKTVPEPPWSLSTSRDDRAAEPRERLSGLLDPPGPPFGIIKLQSFVSF